MATATKPTQPALPTLGRELDESEEQALTRTGNVLPSPLNDLVTKAASTVGKAYGVGVTEEYPKSTVMTHLAKAGVQTKLAEMKGEGHPHGLKIRTWNKADGAGANKDWPHIAFRVVPIVRKDEPAGS